MKSIRQLAKEQNVNPSMVFSRLNKGWTIEEALMPKGWKRKQDIQEQITKLDKELIYIGGYENRNSKITIKCNRCGNTFERVYGRLVERKKDNKLCCEVCQTNNTNKRLQKEREKHFIKTIAYTQPHIKYISGFIDNKSKVLVECNKCGYRFNIMVDRLMRKNIKVQCEECNKKEKERNKMLKQQRKLIIDLKQQRENNRKKEINRINRHLNKRVVYIKQCNICKEEYYTKYPHQLYCNECAMSKKAYDKSHSNKPLKKIYERDKGICYICGKKCDYEDYTYRGNTFIAGNYYPSIDHVIPLIKGGTDTYDNLKLAHRICNSIKSIEERGNRGR